MHFPRKVDCLRTNASRMAVASLVFLFCLTGAQIASAIPARSGTKVPSPSSATCTSNGTCTSNSYFAIADFDGDREPDLATVEVQRPGAAPDALYSIRFELTAGAKQSFGVMAPTGGLQILARDVNGDSFLDLLVRTAWQHQAVAVLLNDGHGNFRLADLNEFAASFREYGTGWNVESPLFHETAIFAGPESPSGELEGDCGLDRPLRCIGTALSAVPFRSRRLLLFNLLGRAPPGVLPAETPC